MKLNSLNNTYIRNLPDEESKGTTMNEVTNIDVLTHDDREDDQLVSTDDLLLAIEVENG